MQEVGEDECFEIQLLTLLLTGFDTLVFGEGDSVGSRLLGGRSDVGERLKEEGGVEMVEVVEFSKEVFGHGCNMGVGRVGEVCLPKVAGGDEGHFVGRDATEEVVDLLHLAFHAGIVAKGVVGTGVVFVFGDAVERLAHAADEEGILRILLEKKVAIVEGTYEFAMDEVESYTLETGERANLFELLAGERDKIVAA